MAADLSPGAGSQLVNVKYVVTNELVEPTLNLSIDVSVPAGSPFIRVMEAAADTNSDFNFTGEYHSSLGYLIIRINGCTSHYDQDKSYWKLYIGSQKSEVGVSSYKPSDGDVVTFKFTKMEGEC